MKVFIGAEVTLILRLATRIRKSVNGPYESAT